MSDTEDYRRVHRLTPLLRFWTLILAILAGALVSIDWNLITSGWELLSAGALLPLLAGLGVFVLLCGAIWLLSHAWWKATGFRLTEEDVSLKRGVINRSLRTARYDRIQAVDVVESVIARIFRLAAVRVETAGGGNSVIEIAYLRKAEAEQLRQEVLARTRGEQGAPAPDQPEAPTPDEPAPGQLIPEIPISRSLLGAALRFPTLFSAVAIVAVALAPVGFATVIPVLVGLVPLIWNYIDTSWRFNGRLDGEVLHISYGLADRRRQSIPLARIHAVTVHQPVLWRTTGWWEVKVSIAGYGGEQDNNTGTTALLPVGDREQAMAVAAALGPLGREELELNARPEGTTRASFTSPRSARWVSPVDRRQQGVTLLADVVVVHQGRLGRRVSVIESSHVQELTLKRGPLQQLIKLCTVRLDLVAGPVHMAGEDLTVPDGQELLEKMRARRLPAMRGLGPGQEL